MNPSQLPTGPAFAVMGLDLISHILGRAAHPGELARYLAEELRELTGARGILMTQCGLAESGEEGRVLCLEPAQVRRRAETGPELAALIQAAHQLKTAANWPADAEGAVVAALAALGFDLALAIPLRAGEIRVGSLVVLGLPDSDRLDEVRDLLQTLAGIVALVLRNAALYQDQERTIAERTRALRESEEQHRSILQTAMDGFWLVDDQGRLLEVNETYGQMSGYSEAELLAMRVSDLEAAETSGETAAHLRKVQVRSEDRFITRHRRKNGTVFDVEVSVQHRTIGGGRLVIFLRDITGRKTLEAQIQQAQKMEAVGQLAGGVAHDYNNILAATMMNLSLFEKLPNLTDDMRESIQELERDAKRAASLTRQLLLFSRRQIAQRQVLDLNVVLDHLLKMLRRLLGEHLELVFREWPTPLWIEADPGMVEQVVMNLCVNARDAMPKGGRLLLRTQRWEVDLAHAQRNPEARVGPFALLTVEDNGCGMDNETLKKIFEPFFTTKDVGKGTGLGLATVYGIVKQHNGWVEVASQVGQGTVFRVCFPLTKAAAAPAAEGGPGQPVGGGETILLVEDEPSVRRTTAAFLKQLGYTVWEAANGVEAMRLWRQHQPLISLLFTDMVMPEGLTGLELAEQLRAQQPGLPVIISSGYSIELLGRGGRTASAITYVPKPCDPNALARTLRECLAPKGDRLP